MAHHVSSMEAPAYYLARPIMSEKDDWLYGGHDHCVSGAMQQEARRMSESSIMLASRWKDAIVKRYVKEPPLKAVTSEYIGQRGGVCLLCGGTEQELLELLKTGEAWCAKLDESVQASCANSAWIPELVYAHNGKTLL